MSNYVKHVTHKQLSVIELAAVTVDTKGLKYLFVVLQVELVCLRLLLGFMALIYSN